ncbi:hypothetical protein GCM10010112_33940 [Actinoplanes lobatus]|uniref:NADH pyrophosphatase NudC (Nudix superfamily) n=1 Tax=Actinoplanes lobatus TaxID=113568 RepID=A0A7W7HHL4_9ACTN|nr:NADH pyrophosphatase NudC (nudix superfamily) [Actinoplanes lobatus]GGN68955.1 hypothetical protein GCM10010112_33940 [Actinoplanes lobatus]
MLAVAMVFLAVGFATGLCLFKIKSRWCPHCGATTVANVPEKGTPPWPPKR